MRLQKRKNASTQKLRNINPLYNIYVQYFRDYKYTEYIEWHIKTIIRVNILPQKRLKY